MGVESFGKNHADVYLTIWLFIQNLDLLSCNIYLPKVEDVIRNRRSIELQVPNDNRPLLYLKPMSSLHY